MTINPLLLPEILRQVFEYLQPSASNVVKIDPIDHVSYIVKLQSVSHTWRSVALSLPIWHQFPFNNIHHLQLLSSAQRISRITQLHLDKLQPIVSMLSQQSLIVLPDEVTSSTTVPIPLPIPTILNSLRCRLEYITNLSVSANTTNIESFEQILISCPNITRLRLTKFSGSAWGLASLELVSQHMRKLKSLEVEWFQFRFWSRELRKYASYTLWSIVC